MGALDGHQALGSQTAAQNPPSQGPIHTCWAHPAWPGLLMCLPAGTVAMGGWGHLDASLISGPAAHHPGPDGTPLAPGPATAPLAVGIPSPRRPVPRPWPLWQGPGPLWPLQGHLRTSPQVLSQCPPLPGVQGARAAAPPCWSHSQARWAHGLLFPQQLPGSSIC